MPLFGHRTTRSSVTPRRSTHHRFFHRKDKDRVAGGYKAALSNPNTTRQGRRHAKKELKLMGRGSQTHVSLMTKIRRALGIRSTRRTTRRAHF